MTNPARPSRGVRLLVQANVVASALLSLAAALFLVRAWEIRALPTEFGPKGVPIAFSLTFAGLGAVVATPGAGTTITGTVPAGEAIQ